MLNSRSIKIVGKTWMMRSGIIIASITLIILYQWIQRVQYEAVHSDLGKGSFLSAYIIVVIGIGILGILQSYHDYSGYMSIRAQRGKYLGAMLFIGIVGSGILMSLLYGVDILCSKVLIGSMPYQWEMIAGLESLGFCLGVAEVVYGLGFFIGAVFYRMRKGVAFCLVGMLPVIMTGIFFSQFLWKNVIVDTMILIMTYLIMAAFTGRGQVFWVMALIVGSILLLKSAPVTRYKHDLL